MTQMELYMFQGLVICAFIFILFIWAWKLKVKYQRESIDHILGEFITREGTGYSKTLLVEGGVVQLEPDDKKGKKGKAFKVAEQATVLVDYPEGPWCPRFLKCKIKKVIFREFSLEPVSNLYSEEPILTPEMFYNARNERMTELGLVHAKEEARAEGLSTKSRMPKLADVRLWLLIIGVAVVAVGVYLFLEMETLKHALGV